MEKKIFKWVLVALATIATIVAIFGAVYNVNPGHRGVLVTLGKVSPTTYVNGVGVKWPFVSEMVQVDVRTKTLNAQTATYTSDVQTAELEYTFTYNLVPENVNKLYEKVGLDYEKKKLVPVLNDVLKDVIGKWQAQDLIANRDQARIQVLEGLKANLDRGFFENLTFQFINIDYSDKFEGAIENKVIAAQKAQEAINNTKRIKEEADQKVITAKAEAEAMQIKAEALAKNKSLVEYEAVKKWDGKMPTTYVGNEKSTPMIQLPTANK